jgi:hypothetical protein
MAIRHAALAAALLAVPSAAQSDRISTTGTLRTDPGPAAPAAAVQARPTTGPMVVAPQAPPPGSNAILRTGTELRVRLLQELTTEGKHLRVGDRVRMETAEPLLVNGVTVIPQGSPVTAEMTEVRNKGMWGKSGKFMARLMSVSANGRSIRLAGTFDDKGHAGGWAAGAVSALVFLPAGFFMTGTSARLPAGTTISGFIDEDLPLALPEGAAPTPAVMTVPAAPAN